MAPAWTVTASSTSTIIEPKTCPTCSKAFRIVYNPSTKVIVDVDFGQDIDGRNIKGRNLASAGGNMYNCECGYCGSTLLLSNS